MLATCSNHSNSKIKSFIVSKQNFLFPKSFLKLAEISALMELISYSVTAMFDESLCNMKSFQSCINARCVTSTSKKGSQ